MAYAQGTCNGMFELLDVIKTLALEVGWELIGDKESILNAPPLDFEGCITSGNLQSYNLDLNSSGGNGYFSIPRKLKPLSFEILSVDSKNNASAKATIWGVRADNTEILLIENATQSGTIVTDESFYRYRTNTPYITRFNIKFENSSLQSKEYNFYSVGESGSEHININLRAFCAVPDLTNLAISPSLNYSPELKFSEQYKSATPAILAGHDKDTKYFISINKNRFIVACRIYEPLDMYEKNPVYQITYAGRIRLHGGQWSLPDTNALTSPSTDPLIRWSSTNGSNLEKPRIYTPDNEYIVAKTNAGGWIRENMNIAPLPNGELFAMDITIYTYSGNGASATGAIFGEYDGVVKIIGTDSVTSEDTITLEGREYIVLSGSKMSGAYDFYAIAKF